MRTALLMIACATGLVACGKVGDLERPGPIFSNASAEGEAQPAQDPAAPVTTVDPRYRSTDIRRPPTAPRGMPNDPFGRPPLPGAAPDPNTARR